MRTTFLLPFALALSALGAGTADAEHGSRPGVDGWTHTGESRAKHHGDWNRQVRGRWHAGWSAPGGWNAYRRPVVGWVLPSYWISPGFYVANWGYYALPAPSYGHGWSRYYDDAVLTDRWGRVVDIRYGYDWTGRDRHRHHHHHNRHDRDRGDNAVGYQGQWVGTWHGSDGSHYSGTYEGRFDGDADSPPPVAAIEPAPLAAPAGVALPYRPIPAHGYAVGRHYYEAGIGRVSYGEVAYAEPVVTTTVTEETTYQTVKRKAVAKRPVRRHYAKPRCNCSCACK